MTERPPTKQYTDDELSWGLRYINKYLDEYPQQELDQMMADAIERRRNAVSIAENTVQKFLDRHQLPPLPKKETINYNIDPKNGLLKSAVMFEYMKLGFALGARFAYENKNSKLDPETISINAAIYLGTLGFITDYSQGRARP